MERLRKEKVVQELKERLGRVNSLFLTEYSGLNVAQMSKIRKELRGLDAEFRVVKNSLLKIALRGTSGEELSKYLLGPNALVSVYRDPVSVAKTLSSFMKEMPQLRVKAGLLGERLLTPEEFQKLSTLPTRDVLLGSLLGLLNNMPVRLVTALKWNLFRLMWTLEAIRSKKEKSKEA